MTVFTCFDDFGSMMTCIYDAWASKLGHRSIRLMTEPICEPELFCQYCHCEQDEKKAGSVIRSIQSKISFSAYELIYLASLSFEADKLDAIYRFLLLGFHYGSSITGRLQEPAVTRLLTISRRVQNESHRFREFLRFSCLPQGILVSHIEPQCRILPLIADYFADRMPSEHWMIIDDRRGSSIIHPADRAWYLTQLSNDERAILSQTESHDPFSRLWQTFFASIAIEARKNPHCQRNLMPLCYRKHMTEFLP